MEMSQLHQDAMAEDGSRGGGRKLFDSSNCGVRIEPPKTGLQLQGCVHAEIAWQRAISTTACQACVPQVMMKSFDEVQ